MSVPPNRRQTAASLLANHWLRGALAILIWLGLGSGCSWVIAEYLVPQPVGGVLWICLGIGLLATLAMIPYNEIEAAVISAIFLGLAVMFSGSVGEGLGVPALADIAVSAIVTGYLASRVVRIEGRPRPLACEAPVNSDGEAPLDSTDGAGRATMASQSDEDAIPFGGDGELVSSADGDPD